MHGKKNLMLWAAVLALALPLFITGTASAKYMSDGAVSDPTGTAGWILPSDFVCVVGLHADGTMDVADGITSARDCIYLNKGTMNGGTPFDLRGMTSNAACTNTSNAGNTADGTSGKAKHQWATSFCQAADGTGLSLTGLDRTQKMCEAKGGTWVTSGKCVAYVRQFKGQNADGTTKPFGAKGTDSSVVTDMGWCYAPMRMDTALLSTSPTVTENCNASLSTAGNLIASQKYDWTMSFNPVATGSCIYNKGIKGYTNANLAKTDGTNFAAAGTWVDLSQFTTMGDCLANGGSWNNWVAKPATTQSVATTTLASTIGVFDYITQVPDADEGCLHCHSTKVEYNGPAERFKDSYVMTGHKNMLRSVKAGQKYVGTDGMVYTTDGTNAIDFTDASITVGGVKQNLYYIFGDWMAALPSVVYGTNGFGSAPGATNGYSCGACHTTGYRDNTNIGTQALGTPGFGTAGIEPQATFPGIVVNAANPKWDINGITCGRCHNAAVPAVSAAMITANAPQFGPTAPLGGGMGALASGTGMTNLCFGCHQSIDKVWPAGTTNTDDPTKIPTGVNHGASWGRDFNGHVLGNSFLNSPHSRYTGTIQLNSLGKYDLAFPNGTTQYSSEFQGYTCWQSSSSSSPAKTRIDATKTSQTDCTTAGGEWEGGVCVMEIKDKTTCENLYGAGAWRSDSQGTCSTCHDVHNSMFVASQEEKAKRKSCEDCHDNATYAAAVPQAKQIDLSVINHPGYSISQIGTPFAKNYTEGSCVVCHMATQAQQNGDQNSMPAHLWRINTSATYTTWPSVDEFNGTNGATKTRSAKTAPETYWGGTYSNAVWVDIDMACGQCHGGSLGSGATHNGAMYFSKPVLASFAKGMHASSPTCTSAPTVGRTGQTLTGYTLSFTDASSDACGTASVSVNWGDGTVSTGATGAVFSHTYPSNVIRTYSITQLVKDTVNTSLLSKATFAVNVPQRYSLVTTVTNSVGGPINGVQLTLKLSGHAIQYAKPAGNTATFTGLVPGIYTVTAYKYQVISKTTPTFDISVTPSITITAP